MASGSGEARAAFDVAVIGAGPAGAATACMLAQRGLNVVLLDRSRFEAARIGESLAPNVQGPLRELGLWSQFLALAPLPSWGTSSLWGGADAQVHSHLHNPYGQGWHVDRRAFDRMLVEGAAAAGARLITGTAVRHCTWHDGVWELRTEPVGRSVPSGTGALVARVLVDATGRSARIGRALGASHLRFDRLVGVTMRWTGVGPAEQGHLLVEAVENGWWYSAPQPDTAGDGTGAMVTTLMTDADLCAQRRFGETARWLAGLQETQATRRRLAGAHCIGVPRVHCARSQRLRRSPGGETGPWLAVGDAALAVDPISGSGVLRALTMAKPAVQAIGALLEQSGLLGPVTAYEAARDEDCAQYLFERSHYYAAETRFAAPFWRRRQLPPPPAPHRIDMAQRGSVVTAMR